MNELTLLAQLAAQRTNFFNQLQNSNDFLAQFHRSLDTGWDRRYAMMVKSQFFTDLHELILDDELGEETMKIFRQLAIEINDGNNPLAKLALGNFLFDFTVYREFSYQAGIADLAQKVGRNQDGTIITKGNGSYL